MSVTRWPHPRAVLFIAVSALHCNALVGIHEPYEQVVEAGSEAAAPTPDAATADRSSAPDGTTALDGTTVPGDASALAEGGTSLDAGRWDDPSREAGASVEASQPTDGAIPSDASMSNRDAGPDTGGSDTACDASCDAGSPPGQSGNLPRSACQGIATDTTSDPKNCGQCGNDCSAAQSRTSCVDSRCARTCLDGYLDCNRDLDRGALGDGCEIDARHDVAHCGSCEPCPSVQGGIAVCVDGVCRGRVIVATPNVNSPAYGSPDGGAPFSMSCPANEVVIGIRGYADSSLYGIGAECAMLELRRAADGDEVLVVPTSALPVVGGNVSPEPFTYNLRCPTSTVVTAVRGTTWTGSQFPEFVDSITIDCSSVAINAAGALHSELSESFPSAGALKDDAMPFRHECASPSAVGGLQGRSGAFIDQVAIGCRTLSVVVR